METNSVLGRNELFSAMSGGKPFKSYIKGILGKVAVVVWDNFSEAPIELILKGDPKIREDGCIVDIWSEKEDVFFKRMNRKLLEQKFLVPYTRPEVSDTVEPVENQYSDADLDEIVNSKYISFLNKVNKIDDVSMLFRLRDAADRNNKSDKITKVIDARIQELQLGEPLDVEPEEE